MTADSSPRSDQATCSSVRRSRVYDPWPPEDFTALPSASGWTTGRCARASPVP